MWRTADVPVPPAVLERREQLLSAALRAIVDRGAASVRLRDIAAEAGVSIGALQHHFESRDEIVTQAFLMRAAQVLAEAQDVAASGPDAWGSLESVIRYATTGEDRRRSAAIWVEACAASHREPTVGEAVAEVDATWLALIADIVGRGVAADDFVPLLPVPQLTMAVGALIDGVELAVVGGRAPEEVDRTIEDVLAAVSVLVGRHRPARPGHPAG